MAQDLWLSSLAPAFAAGMVLGGIYFAALWLTVQRLPRSPFPGRLVFSSYLARSFLVLGGLYLVMGDQWERAVSALAGFIILRVVLTRTISAAQAARRS